MVRVVLNGKLVVVVHINVTVTPTDSVLPPIVFTHGWVDNSTVWNSVRRELGDRTTMAWDLRGHGQSDSPPPGEYGREAVLADLQHVLGQFDKPVVLAGHSLGGYLSLAYTLQHPEQVAGLALIASGPGFRNADAREQWNRAVDLSAAKLDLPAGSEEISKHTDSWVLDELGTITAPTVVIVGENDKRFQPAMKVFEAKLNVIHSAVIGGAGHSVHRKYPGPVAAAIRQLDVARN
ncbi:MAG: alpha/beta hydrolase [Acidimicrobiales bacterium]|nr:alpha/beta hydrolase [Acidimicrobiales bacterium]